MFSDSPYERFGRLDPLSKQALVAAEMLGLPNQSEAPESSTAVVLGTAYGCAAVDADFHRSIGQPGGASPTLFTYTLPNVAAAEISIRFGLTGPNLCLMTGPGSGLDALWEGMRIIREAQADACVCVAADALPAEAEYFADKVPFDKPRALCFAYAFLMEHEARAIHGEAEKLSPMARLVTGGEAAEFGMDIPVWQYTGRLCHFLLNKSGKYAGDLRLRPPSNSSFEQAATLQRTE
jgi:hypothetical protein